MTIKTIKLCLHASSALLLIAAALVLAWGLFTPVRLSAPSLTTGSPQTSGPTQARQTSAHPDPTREQLHAISAIDLRRPLRDPPPLVVEATPLQAKLVGTFYQQSNPQDSQAIFRLADGSERLLKSGEMFEDPAGTVTVKKVDEFSVIIELQGQQRELTSNRPQQERSTG